MDRIKSKWGILVVAGIAICFLAPPASAATIGVGDVAIIGLNTDAPDEFAWVPLINLDVGDQLFFTDTGWNSGGPGFANTIESALLFTTPAGGLSAGTVQFLDTSGAVPGNYSAQGAPQFNGGNLLLSFFGDQLAIFTGSAAAPTFIFAMTNHANFWGLGASMQSTSDLYAGLTDGVNAVATGATNDVDLGEFDNTYYTGPTSGDKTTLLAAISDSSNWAGSQDPITDITNGTLGPGGGFDVAPPGGGGPVVPLPAPAWMGLSLLCALFVLRRVRNS